MLNETAPLYTIKDNYGIYWLIPLSSQLETYRQKIANVEIKRGKGKCMSYHIGVISGEQRVFRISDMIPVTINYIDGEFTIGGNHYIVKDRKMIKIINQKSRN